MRDEAIHTLAFLRFYHFVIASTSEAIHNLARINLCNGIFKNEILNYRLPRGFQPLAMTKWRNMESRKYES